MLELVGVRHEYDGRVVLQLERFAVPPGTAIAVVGPNGSGKSTLLRLLALLERPTQGRVLLDGAVVTASRAARRRVTLVEQRPILFRATARENIEFGLQVRGVGRAEVNRRVENVAARLGITPLLGRRRHELSDGEVQRLAVARALAVARHRLFGRPRPVRLAGANPIPGRGDGLDPPAPRGRRRPRHGRRGGGAHRRGHRRGGARAGARARQSGCVFVQGERRARVLTMPISYLTRIVEFTATHRIQRADWSADRNAAEFGKAATDHPHHYQVRVTIRGPLEPERKGVVNLGELDRVLRDEITARLDGKVINDAIPEFAAGGRLATGEALAVYLWERIAPRVPSGAALHAVRVQEGPHVYSEYFGEA